MARFGENLIFGSQSFGRWLSGVGCRWERSYMVASFGEKMIFRTRVLGGAKA